MGQPLRPRGDLHLSTLRNMLDATNGELELIARFSSGSPCRTSRPHCPRLGARNEILATIHDVRMFGKVVIPSASEGPLLMALKVPR